MKRLLVCLILLLVPALATADTWCQWDGSAGVNCTSTTKTSVVIGGVPVTVSAENLNPRGWYKLNTVFPSLGENQVRDELQWSFANDEIERTWTVRDLTATEIDQGIASPMPLSEYFLWKALLVKGVITQQEAVAALPQELIDAYQARDRLQTP